MKVGFFDSGVGGLCVLKAFQEICPTVETVYLADRAHAPYGNKTPEEIRARAEACTKALLAQGCQMIVVACNTATGAAIDSLRACYPDIPFVGIEPAIKPAARRSKTGIVGVLATAGTFAGRLYNETKARFAKGTTVLAVVADDFVQFVEKWKGGKGTRGNADTPMDVALHARAEKMVRAKVEPLLKAGADVIVLGCTHFPHLKGVIEEVCDGRAEVIDPSRAVARQAKRVLKERGLL